MPETTGVITRLITNPKENNKVFGATVAGDDYVWSFPEYRGEPFEDTNLQVNTLVRLEYEEREKDGKTKRYVNVLECPASGKAASPFQGAVPVPTVAPPTQRGDLWLKDRLMCRESCAKSATAIFAASIQAGIYKTHPDVSAVTAYAQALESWCLKAVEPSEPDEIPFE